MNKVFGMALVALLVAAVGCTSETGGPGPGEGGIGGPRTMPDDPITTPDPDPVTSTTSTLVVTNDSGYSIWYLYVSESVRSDWGVDQLGAEILDPGESVRLTGIPCGQNYDLKADGVDGTLATQFGVYFACGETMTWRLY